MTSWKDLSVEQFALFYLLHPKIGNPFEMFHAMNLSKFSPDIVVLGTGSKVQRVNLELLHNLKKKGLSVEVQDTVGFNRNITV